jgi:hypothetical protein
MSNPIGQWFKCKACGQPCAILPRGGIAHVKPDHLAGVPNSVPCEAYRRTHTREDFFRLMAGEPMEAPTSFEPFSPGGSS